MGAAAIAWTARAMVGCFAARILMLLSRRSAAPGPVEVAAWTAGWALLAVHVLCAFHFEHHWSHTAAYGHTARRTAETIGWNWGGGLYFNYATLGIWAADVIMLFRAYRTRSRPLHLWSRFAIAWIAFMIVNATVVFGPNWWWGVAAGCAVIAAAQFWRNRRSTVTDS